MGLAAGTIASASVLFASFARRDARSGTRVDHDTIRSPKRRPRGATEHAIGFDTADTDKDGSLTFEEIEIYSRANGR